MALRNKRRKTAFVLGGGGHHGAYEVGMLKAVLERGITPNLVVGASIGALNGALVASEPTLASVERLRKMWLEVDDDRIFGGSILSGAANLVRTRTHMHSNHHLRKVIEDALPFSKFDELPVPFQCVAACIERFSEHWFSEGPLVEAILASSAVPGVLPAVQIKGEHFIDGGIVNSIPISRAVELGAHEIFVFHVGRVEKKLTAPTTPMQVAFVAFEIARRHRFARDLANLPPSVMAHVLPSGASNSTRRLSELNYRNFKAVSERIDKAYRATTEYLNRTLS